MIISTSQRCDVPRIHIYTDIILKVCVIDPDTKIEKAATCVSASSQRCIVSRVCCPSVVAGDRLRRRKDAKSVNVVDECKSRTDIINAQLTNPTDQTIGQKASGRLHPSTMTRSEMMPGHDKDLAIGPDHTISSLAF